MNPDKSYHILIVDDQQDNVFLLKMLLNRQPNFKVESVENGFEAVEYISGHDVDLVLMDVMMPVMDGNTATKRLREQYDSSELPIIMVTTLSDVGNLVKSFDNGANDYVTKPIEWNALKARINSSLKVRDVILHEKELMKQTSKLNHRLKEFSFSIAHDIRNPLAHISVLCSSIQDNLISAEEGIPQIDHLAKKTHQFMDSILEHSAYGKQEKAGWIDMNALLEDILKFLADRISENKAKISIQTLPSIYGTYGLLFQLIINLVGNALKYYRPNSIPEVEVYAETASTEVKLFIKDNGLGMSKEDLAIVGQPLTRGASSHGTKGSGLGLSLAKNIVAEFHGKLNISSKLGMGTTIELVFPTKITK